MSHEITLESLIEDLHGIELEIQEYEKKYKLLSCYFLPLYDAGILEENHDFGDWAALLGMRAKRIELFKQFLPEAMSNLPTNGTLRLAEPA
ncbi:MAG: hypothetical protein ONB44_17510 [candidate division KSB1 bacterium]|nr:hypothetical protein [candidate division KSB1 bacterium]MDZ7303926.1 hypothetical protein [candidate division KSB1 bacterium]MDZ7313087.1 hypothetical protein [candidate division KSB1 bacterium]